MRRRLPRALAFAAAVLAFALAPMSGAAQDALQRYEGPKLPEHVVKDAGAPAVTAANVLENDTFWPYRVALVEPWRPVPQAEPLPTELEGVLVRVESGGVARIDFGRGGVQRVPVDKTDLVQRANRLRLGEDEKAMPNLAYQVAPRLVDATSETPRAYPLPDSMAKRGFLCVFADPDAPDFAELAKALAPLADHPGVLTILFPQGEHPDEKLRESLRARGWNVAFVLDFMSEAYTATLIDPGTPMPVVQLQTNEGRMVLEGPWKPGLEKKLRAALDTSFPPEAQAAASSTAPLAMP